MLDRLPIVHPSPALLAVDAAIVTFFVTLAVLWCREVWSRSHNRAELILHAVFAAYLVLLLSTIFLPLHGLRAAADSFDGTHPLSRAWHWGLRVHSPVSGVHPQWQRVANMAMTVPFGYGFGLLAPGLGIRRIFAACIAFAASLEFAQLAVSVLLGIVYRTFDVNDIIDNAFGASVGLALYALTAAAVRATGFGRDAPETTIRGYVAASADRYFAAHEARHHPGADTPSCLPASGDPDAGDRPIRR